MINGNIVWLYDDTECMDLEGTQLSFVSNTAAYQTSHDNTVSTVTDFGVANLGKDPNGALKTAILAGTTVGKGGWIPFQPDELRFNEQMKGKERVAICRFPALSYINVCDANTEVMTGPGTSPTPISTTEAFLYAPLVYVDSKPQNPPKEYQARGMTLITITAPNTGPIAIRQGDLIISGTQVAYGGFSTLLGFKSTGSETGPDDGDRDAYLFGMTNNGLQLARAGINDLTDFAKYTFWNPLSQNFSTTPPKPGVMDNDQIYMPGTFSSGNVFYSPYFQTFIMVYFNKMVDSTFYIRYLQLDVPLGKHATWIAGGKDGKGVIAEDIEALIRYAWSSEQTLYASPPGPGGFNYAAMAHPEFCNTQYYPRSLYPPNTPAKRRVNGWYCSITQNAAGGDGRNLLLSWTSQVSVIKAHSLRHELKGDSQKVAGIDNGIYEVQLAMLEFDDIPPNPDGAWTPTSNAAGTPTEHEPIKSVLAQALRGNATHLFNLGANFWWSCFFVMMHFFYAAGLYRPVI